MESRRAALAVAITALLIRQSPLARTDAASVELLPSAPAPASGPPSSSPAAPHTVHRPWTTPLVAGGVTLNVSWGAALLYGVGGLLGSIESECRCETQYELFMIPIAGPLIVASRKDRGEIPFSTPTLVTWSLIEATGAALILVGAAGHDVPARRPPPGPRVSLVPVLSPRAGGLVLGVTW